MNPADPEDRTAKIRALRAEVDEIQAALDQFKSRKTDEGWALLFRYVASRVADISKALAEFDHVQDEGEKTKTTAA